LFVEVSQIAPEGLPVDRALVLSPLLQSGGEPAPVSDIRLAGRFGRVRGDFVFRGSIEAVIHLNCSRCLAVFPFPVRGSCHRIYRAGPLAARRDEGDFDDEDLALTPFDGVRIDLDEMVREQIYLWLPLKPLCRENCAGFCPRCGANRNAEPCGCPEEPAGSEPLTLKIRF
jgi:uncharacterized protein